MTIPKTNKASKKAKVLQELSNMESDVMVEGWELFNPGDVYETRDLQVFNYFLNSKGTCDIELVNMRVEKFILAIKGYVNPEKEKATVFLSQDITNIKHSDKVDMITNLYFLPTVGSIVKNRMGSTLAHYFGVQKETEA